MRFLSVHVVHPYSSFDTSTALKKSFFILSDISDFHKIGNLLIAVYVFTFSRWDIASDEFTLSTTFRSLVAWSEDGSFSQYMNSVLFALV